MEGFLEELGTLKWRLPPPGVRQAVQSFEEWNFIYLHIKLPLVCIGFTGLTKKKKTQSNYHLPT